MFLIHILPVQMPLQKRRAFNIDGNGNRVSAMIFGPKQVILVVGINKIVPDMECAEKRLKSIASPANCIRLNKKTPCSTLGSCRDCSSPDRFAVLLLNLHSKDMLIG